MPGKKISFRTFYKLILEKVSKALLSITAPLQLQTERQSNSNRTPTANGGNRPKLQGGNNEGAEAAACSRPQITIEKYFTKSGSGDILSCVFLGVLGLPNGSLEI